MKSDFDFRLMGVPFGSTQDDCRVRWALPSRPRTKRALPEKVWAGICPEGFPRRALLEVMTGGVRAIGRPNASPGTYAALS